METWHMKMFLGIFWANIIRKDKKYQIVLVTALATENCSLYSQIAVKEIINFNNLFHYVVVKEALSWWSKNQSILREIVVPLPVWIKTGYIREFWGKNAQNQHLFSFLIKEATRICGEILLDDYTSVEKKVKLFRIRVEKTIQRLQIFSFRIAHVPHLNFSMRFANFENCEF